MTTVNSVEKTKFRKSIDTIALFGIILAGIAIPVTIATPEARCFFNLSNDCDLIFVELTVKTEDNEPLEGVKIKYESSKYKNFVDSQRTDNEGELKIKIPKNGDVRITIFKNRYSSITDTITPGLNSSFSKVYQLKRESNSYLVDFTALVLTEEGKPVEGVKVQFNESSEPEETNIKGSVSKQISSAESFRIILTKKGFYPYEKDIDLGNNSTYTDIFRLKEEVDDPYVGVVPTLLLPGHVLDSEVIPLREGLSKEETDLAFITFMNAWNSKDYNTQLFYLSNDFVSESYDISKQESSLYSRENYEEYSQKKKEIADSKDGIKVNTLSNPTFHKIDNRTALVRYLQEYKRSSGYESKGTNELYFRKRGGKVEIYQEFFIRDSCKNCR